MEATKLTALEEEISILKGEIKSILQEVRTAILASENPFTGGLAARPAVMAVETQPSEPKVVQLNEPPPVAMPPPVQANPTPPSQPAPAPIPEPPVAHTGARDPMPAFGHEASAPQARPAGPLMPGRGAEPSSQHYVPDVRALAALLTWVEETRQRLDERRYKVVLSLARYGELIEAELEKTLLDAGKTVGGKDTHERASVNDSIVALRQLEAILAPEGNVRRLADYALVDGPHREVWPSRRQ